MSESNRAGVLVWEQSSPYLYLHGPGYMIPAFLNVTGPRMVEMGSVTSLWRMTAGVGKDAAATKSTTNQVKVAFNNPWSPKQLSC